MVVVEYNLMRYVNGVLRCEKLVQIPSDCSQNDSSIHVPHGRHVCIQCSSSTHSYWRASFLADLYFAGLHITYILYVYTQL